MPNFRPDAWGSVLQFVKRTCVKSIKACSIDQSSERIVTACRGKNSSTHLLICLFSSLRRSFVSLFCITNFILEVLCVLKRMAKAWGIGKDKKLNIFYSFYALKVFCCWKYTRPKLLNLAKFLYLFLFFWTWTNSSFLRHLLLNKF